MSATLFDVAPVVAEPERAPVRRLATETPAPTPPAKPARPRERRTAPPPAPVRRAGRAHQRVTVLAVVVVAAVAAIASFDHQRELAVLAGEGWRAWLLPLSVDGLVVAATMVMLDRRRAGQAAGALPWLSLVLGVAASLAANVAAAEPTLVGRLVAAWPPVALLLAFELLLRQVDGRPRQR